MTQRIFDIENEKDMADLWDILPDWDEFDDSYGKCDCVTATDDEQDLIGREWIGDKQ